MDTTLIKNKKQPPSGSRATKPRQTVTFLLLSNLLALTLDSEIHRNLEYKKQNIHKSRVYKS